MHLGKAYERLGVPESETTTQLIMGPTEPPFLSFLVILPRGQRGARSCPSSEVGGVKEILSIQRVKAQENKCWDAGTGAKGVGETSATQKQIREGRGSGENSASDSGLFTLPGNWPALNIHGQVKHSSL